MPANYLKWGEWNAICDICGFKFKSSQLRRNWKNEMVCEQDWEPRHPQDFLRVRGDKPSVPWTRYQGEIVSPFICYIWTSSAYADLGTADCMKADYTPLPYPVLVEMQYPQGEGDLISHSAIPQLAIPGSAWPGFID